MQATSGKRCAIEKQGYLVSKLRGMIVNLLKNFKFSRNEKLYEIEYLFSNKTEVNSVPGICLNLNISVDGADKKSYQVSKPTSILYLSNEAIEKIIEEDSVAL